MQPEDFRTEEVVRSVLKKELPKYMSGQSFTQRKLTDLPTDALQVVNRKYVNLNGATAGRPTGSVLGQFYFDTTIGKPIWWSGSTWVDATGSAA